MQTGLSIIKRITTAFCSFIIAFAAFQFSGNISFSDTNIIASAEESVINHNTLFGASLTLTGEIGVNFYLDIEDSASFDKIILDGPNGEKSISANEIEPETSGSYSGKYKLTYLVDPTQIDDSVSMCLKKGNENVPLFDSYNKANDSDVVQFSVRKYIETVQNNESADSELLALVNALNVYGKYSCVQFKNAPDPESDSILANVNDINLEKYKFSKNGELPEGVSILGATLVLDSETSFRIYFDNEPNSAAIDGNTAKIKQKNGMYYIEVPDISAADLDKTHQAVIGDCTMDFSALSYAYSVLNINSDSSDVIVKLVKALYAYNYAANMYFEASAGSAPTLSETDFTVNFDSSDDYADNYSFTYGDETFLVHYTPYLGGDWKIVDSFKITNRADMVIICEKLLKINQVEGRITQYRTAKDMADEWEIHNQGYKIAKSLSMASAVERLKDVDLDKKDQGKTFDDFLAEFLGK